MTKLLTILFFCTSATTTYACCAENNYRLFPLGEVGEHVVFLELKLSRFCRFERDSITAKRINSYWMHGTIALVKWQEDSLVFLEVIDTVKFKECDCRLSDEQFELSNYEEQVAPYYHLALNKVSNMQGYSPIQPVSISFNEKASIDQLSSDTSFYYKIQYGAWLDLNLTHWDIVSCYPSKIPEVRLYESENFRIEVIRLSCQEIDDGAIKYRRQRFKKCETAFWKEKATWHGISRDLVRVEKK